MAIRLKRAYDKAEPDDGRRVLVDRIWPRGISKDDACIDDWLRDAAPSNDLRKAFHRGDIAWQEFRQRYLGQLKDHRQRIRPLAQEAKEHTVTLVYGAKDEKRNNAVVLAQYMKMLC